MVTKYPPRWKKKNPPYEIGKDGFGVKDVIKNGRGWSDVNVCRPHPYDLVRIMLQSHREKTGWWTGQFWEGLRLKEGETPLFWKDEEKCL